MPAPLSTWKRRKHSRGALTRVDTVASIIAIKAIWKIEFLYNPETQSKKCIKSIWGIEGEKHFQSKGQNYNGLKDLFVQFRRLARRSVKALLWRIYQGIVMECKINFLCTWCRFIFDMTNNPRLSPLRGSTANIKGIPRPLVSPPLYPLTPLLVSVSLSPV